MSSLVRSKNRDPPRGTNLNENDKKKGRGSIPKGGRGDFQVESFGPKENIFAEGVWREKGCF